MGGTGLDKRGGSPCLRMRSTKMSITMMVPVRPMPAL